MVDLTPEAPEIPAPPSATDAERRRINEDARAALNQGGRRSTILTRNNQLGIRANTGAGGGGPLRPSVGTILTGRRQ